MSRVWQGLTGTIASEKHLIMRSVYGEKRSCSQQVSFIHWCFGGYWGCYTLVTSLRSVCCHWSELAPALDIIAEQCPVVDDTGNKLG